MIGIYKITNKINGNSYIGLSIDIKRRWKAHHQRHKDESNKEYEKVLYKAFRKYGIGNFEFSIVEECPLEKLREREKYWVAYFDTYYHGYNSTEGGEDILPMPGEKHPNHKLTENDVIYIRELWASKLFLLEKCIMSFNILLGKADLRKFTLGRLGKTFFLSLTQRKIETGTGTMENLIVMLVKRIQMLYFQTETIII